jgi:hypothetical protein
MYTTTKEIIICGAFNINYLTDSTYKQVLDSLLASCGLCSAAQFPTRIQNKSSSAIDNLFINTLKFSNFSLNPIINGLSDHDVQILIICNIFEKNGNNYFYVNRKFDKYSINDFSIKLSHESWEDIFSENNVNIIFNNFLDRYLKILYSSFATKKVHYRSGNKAWLTQGIKISCINKRTVFLILRNTNDPNVSEYYTRDCRILTKVIKLAKKSYYNSNTTHSNNKNKTSWNIIKNISNIKPTAQSITSIKINGNLSYNGQTTAESFNKYSVSIAQNLLVNKHKVNYDNPILYLFKAFTQPFPAIKLKCVSSKGTEDITKSLKIKDSHGYDRITTKILKMSIPYISFPLTYICNRILPSGIFPMKLKFSEIKPIFKGLKNDTSNYRPVSLLTSFSKIFEKVIYKRLYQHINHNHILVDEQFGFRQASSTDIVAYKLTKNILTALSNKMVVGGSFCDLHKAFVCVNYILLSQMEFYGISGKANNLIKSYLQDRYQRALVDLDSIKYYSEWQPVTDGVPQGSILGPLLFLLCVNDLPNIRSDTCNPVLYADDTSLIIPNSDIQRLEKHINTTIIQLNRWFNSNLLLLDLEKTHSLQFLTKNTKAPDLHISYANKKISSIQSTKFLGLLIDNNLSWHCHIDQMIPKLNKASYIIRSLKQVMSVESLMVVYFSIFHSIMLYGIMFWAISTYNKIIFKIQKRVIRIITYSSNKDSCQDLFKKLNILPLQSQYLLTLLTFVLKNKEFFKMNLDVHNFSTRSNHDLHLPKI